MKRALLLAALFLSTPAIADEKDLVVEIKEVLANIKDAYCYSPSVDIDEDIYIIWRSNLDDSRFTIKSTDTYIKDGKRMMFITFKDLNHHNYELLVRKVGHRGTVTCAYPKYMIPRCDCMSE